MADLNLTLWDGMIDAIAGILARYGEDDAARVALRYEHAVGIDRAKLMNEARKRQFTPKVPA